MSNYLMVVQIHRFLFQNIKTRLFLEVFLYFGKDVTKDKALIYFFQ